MSVCWLASSRMILPYVSFTHLVLGTFVLSFGSCKASGGILAGHSTRYLVPEMGDRAVPEVCDWDMALRERSWETLQRARGRRWVEGEGSRILRGFHGAVCSGSGLQLCCRGCQLKTCNTYAYESLLVLCRLMPALLSLLSCHFFSCEPFMQP